MTTDVPVPFFADAPVEYDAGYFAQMTRSFASIVGVRYMKVIVLLTLLNTGKKLHMAH